MKGLLFALLLSQWCPAVDFDQGVDVRQTVRTLKEEARQGAGPQAASPVRPAEAEWTIMYFINGKNNLAGYVDRDLTRMEKVGSSDQVKIVVQVGKSAETVKRYLMQRSSVPASVNSPVVQDLGRLDMGDWRNLAAFGKWAKANYPAKRYMLSIWNHGNGWLQATPGRQQQQSSEKAISMDDETRNRITTTELAQALAAMGGVDMLSMDACLMQMAEVGYQLRQHAGLIVASQASEPGQGWDYAMYLQPLSQNPSMTPQQLSQAYLDAFRLNYTAQNQDTTQSIVDPAAYAGLVPLLNAWTRAVIQADEKDVVRGARGSVQEFDDADNVDLVHLVTFVGHGTQSGAVRSAGEALLRHVRERLVLGSATTGRGYENANGVALYLPRGPVSGDYRQLAWASDSEWPAFARWVGSLFEQQQQQQTASRR